MTRIQIDKIYRKPKQEKSGLADICFKDEKHSINMTVQFDDEIPHKGEIDADIILYAYDDYDVYEDEEQFNIKNEYSLSPESFIPIGNLQTENPNFKKNPDNFISGIVLSSREFDDYYAVELKSLGITYYANYHKNKSMPKVGNVISSVYVTYIETIKEEDYVN